MKKLCNSAKLDSRYRAALNNGCGAGHGDSAEMGAGWVPGYGSGLGAGRTSGSASFKFDEREVKMPKIAVAGVKGSTGREFLNLLNESGIPADDVFALEAKAPLGTLVSYGEDDELDVSALETFDFKKADIAIFATTKEQGKRFIKKATGAGCRVIDLSGATFGDSSVPLVIPELNGELLKRGNGAGCKCDEHCECGEDCACGENGGHGHCGCGCGTENGRAADGLPQVIGVPSSAVYQILLPLAGVIKEHKLKRLVVTTFNSTSYYGREAMDELFTQSRKIFLNETLVDDEQIFKKQIAFNVLPQVGEFIGEETSLEWAINAEIKKVLDSDIKVHANCAFVPTFIGDAAFVNAEFDDEVDATAVREAMKAQKNVVVFDKTVDAGYVSVDDVQGEDSVYVSRVRQDVSVENGISFWTVADNLRAGGAKLAFSVMTAVLAKA